MKGRCRIIANFGIWQNSDNYIVSQHSYKINFIFTSSVVRCEDDMSVLIYGFKFVPIDDIR